METGKNRQLVLASNNMDMFAVSVFEDYIYWSDRSVSRCNFKYLLARVNLINHFYQVKNVKLHFAVY